MKIFKAAGRRLKTCGLAVIASDPSAWLVALPEHSRTCFPSSRLESKPELLAGRRDIRATGSRSGPRGTRAVGEDRTLIPRSGWSESHVPRPALLRLSHDPGSWGVGTWGQQPDLSGVTHWKEMGASTELARVAAVSLPPIDYQDGPADWCECPLLTRCLPRSRSPEAPLKLGQ